MSPQFIYRFNTITIKSQAGICTEIHKLLQKTHETEKNSQVGKIFANYISEKELDTQQNILTLYQRT